MVLYVWYLGYVVYVCELYSIFGSIEVVLCWVMNLFFFDVSDLWVFGKVCFRVLGWFVGVYEVGDWV